MKHLRTDWQGIQDVTALLAATTSVATFIEPDNRYCWCTGEDGRHSDACNTLRDEVMAMFALTQGSTGPCSIEAEEPVFMVRSKDPVSAETVRYWASIAHAHGSEYGLVERVQRWSGEMFDYARRRFKGKQHAPDAPSLLS